VPTLFYILELFAMCQFPFPTATSKLSTNKALYCQHPAPVGIAYRIFDPEALKSGGICNSLGKYPINDSIVGSFPYLPYILTVMIWTSTSSMLKAPCWWYTGDGALLLLTGGKSVNPPIEVLFSSFTVS